MDELRLQSKTLKLLTSPMDAYTVAPDNWPGVIFLLKISKMESPSVVSIRKNIEVSTTTRLTGDSMRDIDLYGMVDTIEVGYI